MTVIATYEVDVADLLHDPTNAYWTLTQLDRYINKARQKVSLDTACLRSLQTIYLTQGQEALTFGQVTGVQIAAGGTGYTNNDPIIFTGGGGSGVAATLGVTAGAVTSVTFTNYGSGYTSVPSWAATTAGGSGATLNFGIINVNTFDVLGLTVIFGSTRYPAKWRPWSIFSAQVRPFVGLQRQPFMWAVYGDTQIYVGPTPDQTYQCEFDSVVLSTDISGSTVDPIPVLCQEPITFYAAYLAKFNDQRFGEAATFLEEYKRKMIEASLAWQRRLPNLDEEPMR